MQNTPIQYHTTLLHSLFKAIVLLLCLVSVEVNAQQIESFVVDNFGATVLVDETTFDVTMGDLAITTLVGEGYTITQGFLQPISLKTPCGDVVLKAFPNPVTSGMKLYAEGCDVEIASIKTYDLFGKLVYEERLANNQINFSSIGVGVYLVRAYDPKNQIVGVVKIVKSTI